MPQQKRSVTGRVEIVASLTLAGLAITTFWLHIVWSQSVLTSRETTLFSVLEFLLTSGFAWFSTRAISRREFETDLKRFAVSAYRRISDIDQMLSRLQNQARSIAQSSPTLEASIRPLEATIADTAQVVRSSSADWSDVIGDDLMIVEQVSRLDQERSDLRFALSTHAASGDAESRLRRVNQELSRLRPRLATPLRIVRGKVDPRTDRHAAEWIAREHRAKNGLRLTVVTGDLYGQERNQLTIKVGESVKLLESQEGSPHLIDAVDESGAVVGRMQNLSPLSYEDFARALAVCYGGLPLSAEVLSIHDGEFRDDGYYAWLELKVVRSPAIEAQ